MRWRVRSLTPAEQLERAAADLRRGAVAADQEASDLERAAAQATVATTGGTRRRGGAGRGGWAAVSGYLGYDVAALGVLLGALEAVRDERLPAGPWSGSPAGRQAASAVEVHRRAVAALGAFTDLVGAVLHGDPLGRYRAVALDPADLGRWALHHGGRWATVTDPFLTAADTSSTFAVVNARMVAATLTPEHVRELLDGDGAGARPLVRYLATLRSAPAARSAFLATLGADGFRALVRVTSTVVTSRHVPGADEAPVARAADDVLSRPGRAVGARPGGRPFAHGGVERRGRGRAGVRRLAPARGRGGDARCGHRGRAVTVGRGGLAGARGRRGPARLDRSRGDRRPHPLEPSAATARRRGASCSTWPVVAIVARSSRCWPTTSPARPSAVACCWRRPTLAPSARPPTPTRSGDPCRPCCPSSNGCWPAGRSRSPPRPAARSSRTAGCCPSASGCTSAASSSTSSTRPTAPARARPACPPGRGRGGTSVRCRASSFVSWPTTGWRTSSSRRRGPARSSGWPAWTCSHRPAPRRCAPRASCSVPRTACWATGCWPVPWPTVTGSTPWSPAPTSS